MPRYALVIAGSFQRTEVYASQPPDIAHKSVKWLLCPVVSQPSFDGDTEIVEGPTYTVGASSVTEVWTKRSLTAQEISDRKDGALAGINGNYVPLRRVLLAHENRIRTLEAQATRTMIQFLAYWKSLL